MIKHFNLLKPFLLFCKFLFLFPHKNYWAISDNWVFFSIIAYALYTCIDIFSFKSLLALSEYNIYEYALIGFVSCTDFLTISIHVTAFLFKKELMRNFLECIGNLYSKSCKRVSINAIFWTIITSVLFLTANYGRIFLRNSDILSSLSIVLSYLIVYTILMQFNYFLDFLSDNFSTLADSIGNTESVLLKQIEQHWHLVELCHALNEFYSKQLLLIMLRIFLSLTFGSFYAVETFIKFRRDPRVLVMMFPAGTNFVWSFAMLLATAHTCEMTKEAADSFHSALSDEIKRNGNLNNVILVMYSHMRPTVHFSVVGFFTLGRHAITSVIAAVVTYLVIFIQVNNPTTV